MCAQVVECFVFCFFSIFLYPWVIEKNITCCRHFYDRTIFISLQLCEIVSCMFRSRCKFWQTLHKKKKWLLQYVKFSSFIVWLNLIFCTFPLSASFFFCLTVLCHHEYSSYSVSVCSNILLKLCLYWMKYSLSCFFFISKRNILDILSISYTFPCNSAWHDWHFLKSYMHLHWVEKV